MLEHHMKSQNDQEVLEYLKSTMTHILLVLICNVVATLLQTDDKFAGKVH
jgi:hypothetical protein